ncbi:hypothetical protein HFD87_10245 [Pantoea sp. EKM21T]|uniref:hypothetical protein n=1 Tax=unclassified Pantoea TaxID=2630326 RepID=UPI00142DDAF6|nr:MULTISPECIES: hypothetical protein [unclassified Pantoea]KAF6676844.1 hypothetical protein HFD87_10245 [Pantoea sp. EKM21T]KAF6685992.1 hypothetical protein HFD90_03850 [Pantoea sp. EKM22T]
MSNDEKKGTKPRKPGNKWAHRAMAKANAERFENGTVPSFDALRVPYEQRKHRGRTADSEDKS